MQREPFDRFTGRVRLLADTVAALGPLRPIDPAAVDLFGSELARRTRNTHRLDRIDRTQQADPHRWPGDDS